MSATRQVENRLTLPKGFGIAAFGGVGGVISGPSQILRSNHFLPAVDPGPRFELRRKYHVILPRGLCPGVNDSWTWSMGVDESF